VRVYFGGSFNPPHIGHQQILMALLIHPGVTDVHLVPTSQNPLKEEVADQLFDYEQRWALVKAWHSHLSLKDQERVRLESVEIDRARAAGCEVPQYTVDSLLGIRAAYPDSEWALAIGEDVLESLPHWKKIDHLLGYFAQVLVFSRGPRKSALTLPAELATMSKFIPMQAAIANVSSTEIRECISTAESLTGALLPEVRRKILDFIK